jgi:hypothetical protein
MIWVLLDAFAGLDSGLAGSMIILEHYPTK